MATVRLHAPGNLLTVYSSSRYINNFIDRSALGQARLGTLEEDLGMDPEGTQFNLAISILFVGYLTMQVSAGLCLGSIS